jgi:Cu/Ag efflux pump CusA
LLLIVEKHPDGNTLQVTRDVEAALEALKPGLPDIAVDSTIFRPATFIELSLHHLNQALLIGCILVIIVLASRSKPWPMCRSRRRRTKSRVREDRAASTSRPTSRDATSVLHVDFGSARLVALVALTLPFALIGGVAAAFLSGGVLSLGSLVGFVTVLGIAGRNGIMLISHYRHLQEEEGVAFGRELAMRGAEERLAPILMTALPTGLALVPIVVGGSRSGQEVEHPMAVVILGGCSRPPC